MKNIFECKVGDKLKVKGINKDSKVKRRLMDMGITPGITIEVTGIAPLGDPIEINVRGYKLTLRKEEASAILL
ncbi:iron transporter FeoA [Clostridium baratii]|uniref:Ferrous iron transporter FeoA-like domain-containing protein n=1 Tax=Clostridium nitritogenes TaxID=83340 RepID=A0ABN1LR11_9CLOT|nr:FeoA family protein [Clostridium baratii]AQM58808.1 ferrous iron transport protein A [Clostridium baratii]MBS6042034.1 ferrous iron transport protein A [Clostridium baratii]MBT9831215.1 ferrous iron transport protein A [Clostridium baratii]MDY3206743.1 FeoA family protein [Clostridium baratii]OPF52604.1 iron transporter FeoA [Clostridium baratii]